MKLFSMITIAAAACAGVVSVATPADARMAVPHLAVPQAAEQVACRTVRERIRRPNGALVWSTKRVCTPGYAMHPRPRCVTERQRVVRPNGAVVLRSVRRCG